MPTFLKLACPVPAAVLLMSLACGTAVAQADIPQQFTVNGFAVGCQANSFNRFTVMEAIEKTARAGGRIIEFYPDQKLSPERPGVLWNHTASEQVISQVKAALDRAGIKAVGYGVVRIPNDETGARRIFEFAVRMGMRTLITESVESIDLIERLAREYDIAVAFHHHPRRLQNPEYKLWDPEFIAGLVKGRDRRIGACVDTGNWTRSGVSPVEGLRILKGRILCVHLKDMNEFGNRGAHEVPFGAGASGVKECLDELMAQGFRGDIAVEYEYNPDDNLKDVSRCIQYVKNYKKQQPAGFRRP